MVHALMSGLESLANLIVAKQASETDGIALACVESSNGKTVGNPDKKAMMVDASPTTEAGGITESEGVDQKVTSPLSLPQ